MAKKHKARMTYVGESRDVGYNPWMRLVNDRDYQVEAYPRLSGEVDVRVIELNGYETVRLVYDSDREFRKEWR